MVCSGVRSVSGLCVCCGMLLYVVVCRLDFSSTNKKRSPHNKLCGDLLCGEVKRTEMSQRIEQRAYTADLISLRSLPLGNKLSTHRLHQQSVCHSQFQYVAVGADVVERKPFDIFGFDLRDVLAVLFREDNLANSGPFGGENLLLDTAYRKDTAT